MGLVDYSDSEGSDTEQDPLPKSQTLPLPPPPSFNTTKPGFQKVVDRSNPGKIRVNLASSLPAPKVKVTTNGDGPPTKRVKIGGGGLNSFLPPPKRTGVTAATIHQGSSRGLGKGLGAGVSLKTGAAPGFSRSVDEDEGDEQSSSSGGNMMLPPPKTAVESTPIPAEEVKLVGRPMMFKPLSVSRNPAKKKKVMTAGGAKSGIATASTAVDLSSNRAANFPQPTPTPRPKVSLFSVATEAEDAYTSTSLSTGDYEPIIHGISDTTEDDLTNYQYPPQSHTTPHSQPQTAHSLATIASDLNLSASDRRQLFGRASKSTSSHITQSIPNVINFNTDQEYEHNEVLRAAGETVSHNPVRAIAPGKHSLKQLVDAATGQKEALEEAFQKGRNNRKEAGARYGW